MLSVLHGLGHFQVAIVRVVHVRFATLLGTVQADVILFRGRWLLSCRVIGIVRGSERVVVGPCVSGFIQLLPCLGDVSIPNDWTLSPGRPVWGISCGLTLEPKFVVVTVLLVGERINASDDISGVVHRDDHPFVRQQKDLVNAIIRGPSNRVDAFALGW